MRSNTAMPSSHPLRHTLDLGRYKHRRSGLPAGLAFADVADGTQIFFLSTYSRIMKIRLLIISTICSAQFRLSRAKTFPGGKSAMPTSARSKAYPASKQIGPVTVPHLTRQPVSGAPRLPENPQLVAPNLVEIGKNEVLNLVEIGKNRVLNLVEIGKNRVLNLVEIGFLHI